MLRSLGYDISYAALRIRCCISLNHIIYPQRKPQIKTNVDNKKWMFGLWAKNFRISEHWTLSVLLSCISLPVCLSFSQTFFSPSRWLLHIVGVFSGGVNDNSINCKIKQYIIWHRKLKDPKRGPDERSREENVYIFNIIKYKYRYIN